MESKTSQLWIDCLIKPVFIILKHLRAECEADWALHLDTVREMMPLFFAAGHTHYARYVLQLLYYLRTMEHLPAEVFKHFIAREHTMHHTPGFFNGIWTDMAVETTYMRYGHGRKGVIGITLKPETLKTWAYSLHACNRLINDLNEIRDKEGLPAQTYHKEEMPSRIKADAMDRKALHEKLELIIDLLNPEQHQEGLINVVTGKVINHQSVNVNNAVMLGKRQMETFEQSWPDGFHDTIPKTVVTMANTRKSIKVGDPKVFDTETIYARAMALQSGPRSLNINSLMSHELAPYPVSMFKTNGQMREVKTKATLKNDLKIVTSGRNARKDEEVLFLDGCAVLWVIPWPTSGTVQNYLNQFRSHIIKLLEKTDVYLVFDRYKSESTKESTRQGRDKGASRVYTL